MENPNKFIKAAVKSKYNIDFDTCPKEDLLRVEEILVKGVTRDDKFNNWDFSAFPLIPQHYYKIFFLST